MSKTGKSILMPRRVEIDSDPIDVAQRLRHLPGFLFFDSANISSNEGSLSILGAIPEYVINGDIENDYDQLVANFSRDNLLYEHVDCGFPVGGLFGHITFDGKYHFGKYSKLLVYLHDRNEWFDIGGLSDLMSFEPIISSQLNRVKFCNGIGKENFCSMVKKAKEYIAAGDIYQVNLSHRFEAEWPDNKDPFDLFLKLRDCSPAPFSAFYKINDQTIISSSPECFLKMSGPGVLTRPIKGTRPRFNDPGEDERSAAELLTSPKEISELIMITDLERNDLGKVCEYGTVRVSELLKLEKFAQVFHLVSTIEGRLNEHNNHLSAFKACFPGGSISGAPKCRSLEIINELEICPREIYTGSIGYFGVNGESQFSIAIRTAYIQSGKLYLHAGAGIVADSDPESEYQETLHKASGFSKRLHHFSVTYQRKNMPRKDYLDRKPLIHPSAFVAKSADLIGAVTVEEEASIWYGAVLRADIQEIKIGPRSNVQDGTIVHLECEQGTYLGQYVTVGHKAILHACTIDDEVLVGMGSILMDGVRVGARSIIGAGALVTMGTEIPPGSLVLGSPAKVVKKLSEEEQKTLKQWAENYIELSRRYIDEKIL